MISNAVWAGEGGCVCGGGCTDQHKVALRRGDRCPNSRKNTLRNTWMALIG